MNKNKLKPTNILNFPTIQLSAALLEHFERGEGLLLSDENDDAIALIHRKSLDGAQQMMIDKESVAEGRAMLAALQSLIVSQNEGVEMNEEAARGLGLLLTDIKHKIEV